MVRIVLLPVSELENCGGVNLARGTCLVGEGHGGVRQREVADAARAVVRVGHLELQEDEQVGEDDSGERVCRAVVGVEHVERADRGGVRAEALHSEVEPGVTEVGEVVEGADLAVLQLLADGGVQPRRALAGLVDTVGSFHRDFERSKA